MSTEIELKLSLTEKTARKLPSHPLLAELPAQKQALLNTYYDTPELALHARRIAVRFRKKGWQWLLTVKSAEPASGGLAMRNEWEVPANPGEFNFSHVDNEALRNFLEANKQKLEPIFTTDFMRRTWHVPYGESTVELAIDRGHIDSRGRQEKICEIELELLDGRIEDIFGLTRELQTELSLYPSIASKAERGYRAFLNTPKEPFRAKPTLIHADQTPVEAFRAIALNCLEHFQRNEPGLSSDDPEFIHQARVALRRLRSAIKLFSPVLPKEFVSAYGRTWKTLGSALGEARNWDVFWEQTLPPILEKFPQEKSLQELRKSTYKKRIQARKKIKLLLETAEYPKLMIEFTGAIYSAQKNDNKTLDSIKQRIEKPREKSINFLKKFDGLSLEKIHKTRIALKQFRYASEFFETTSEMNSEPSLQKIKKILGKIGEITDLAGVESLLKSSNTNNQIVIAWTYSRLSLAVENLSENIQSITINQKKP